MCSPRGGVGTTPRTWWSGQDLLGQMDVTTMTYIHTVLRFLSVACAAM